MLTLSTFQSLKTHYKNTDWENKCFYLWSNY